MLGTYAEIDADGSDAKKKMPSKAEIGMKEQVEVFPVGSRTLGRATFNSSVVERTVR